MEPVKDEEELPIYMLGRIRRLSSDIMHKVNYLGKFYGETLTGYMFDRYTGAVKRYLKVQDRRCVRESLAPFMGKELTHKLGAKIAQLLAGNLHTLKAGKTIKPWVGISDPEWFPVKVIKAIKGPKWGEKLSMAIYFTVLAGEAVGQSFVQLFPATYAVVFAAELGFPRYKQFEYKELAGMWTLAKLEQDKTGDLRVSEVNTRPHHLTHNRKLRKSAKEDVL